MANKLAIIALAAAAVAAAPALAQEAPSPSPGLTPNMYLRVCDDAAGPNAFLEGCEELHVAQESWGFIVEGKYCVVLDDCLDVKVRPGSAGPQATQMIYCILRIEKRSLSAILYAPARAKVPTQTGRRSCRGGAQGYPWGACAQGEAIIATPLHLSPTTHARITMRVFPCAYSQVFPFLTFYSDSINR